MVNDEIAQKNGFKKRKAAKNGLKLTKTKMHQDFLFSLTLILFSVKSGPEMATVILSVYWRGDKRKATLSISSRPISGQMFML